MDSPSVLEAQIGVARKAVTGVARDVHRRVHGAVSEWIGIEHAVERACLPLRQTPFLYFLTIYSSRPGQGPHRS